ncbi:cysteine hydrolase family protein [Microbacterium sp. NPDC096154]|uniref:cysteine hydrolase family protein n=1 Tax=Microbacterium sp. NPDC096154 TaxID=3155549 RepID=UPI003326C4C8
MTTALIVIDMQQGFLDPFWGATTNHPGCDDNVVRLIDAWHSAGDPIVVVRHDSVNPDSPLHPANPGNALIEPVAEADRALLVTKSVNSAFYGEPDLESWLRSCDIRRIVVCGIQTNMCVETTARMGGNLGFEVVVPLDATRTFDLAGPDGQTTDAATLMATTAVNLHGGGFASVTTTDAVLADARQGARA